LDRDVDRLPDRAELEADPQVMSSDVDLYTRMPSTVTGACVGTPDRQFG
jgi:hypothetical protein